MSNFRLHNLTALRPRVEGKFIVVDGDKFYIKGVTYGTFKPDEAGNQFPDLEIIQKDFALMAQYGINAIRTYTVPPTYLLDIAEQYGLKVMVGLPWEQHITFLDDVEKSNAIIQKVQNRVRACSQHKAILCYTVGNEIPPPIVRWYGPQRIETFIHKLYRAIKAVDPDGLVTYVNYPTTEYLQLPFLDFDCFNVYLETEEKLGLYLARLHNLTGDRPLVMAEIGLDSQRNGQQKQAQILEWQIKTILARGCAGIFVFAWTDEWWRGGYEIDDWDFGLVDRSRNPKPALAAVAHAYQEAPFHSQIPLPKISVVVCTYNGSATISDTLDGLLTVDYPDFEVIVVNDGSTDKTADIVCRYPFQLISTENGGLSCARNTGIRAAQGEIVAFIDDDAYPDKHWLRYLAYSYLTTDHGGVGGPNILPPNDGLIATCVANAPGGPVHVLTTDEIAEHIPGCNMSFRRDVLLEVGGLDPIFRTAGDDVDLCWRVQHTGRTIGFHPAAIVWHHRRNSLKAYWNQQKGYGRAEALLERKWPEKYNRMGHLSWGGRIYGNGVTQPLRVQKGKIFYGIWGTAPFQSLYQPAPDTFASLPLMPEWYLLIGFLGGLSIVGLAWPPLLYALPFALATLLIVVIQACISAANARFDVPTRQQYLTYWALTAALHFIQPIARLHGRFTYGLTPWRKRGPVAYSLSQLLTHTKTFNLWSEVWRSTEDWLNSIQKQLLSTTARVRSGGSFDSWDLLVSSGFFTTVYGLMTIEEHGAGKQLIRFKCKTKYSTTGLVLIALLLILAVLAGLDKAYSVCFLFSLFAFIINVNFFTNTARAMSAFKEALDALVETVPGVTYLSKVAVINKNDSRTDEETPIVSTS